MGIVVYIYTDDVLLYVVYDFNALSAVDETDEIPLPPPEPGEN